jgi:hypothetical protein
VVELHVQTEKGKVECRREEEEGDADGEIVDLFLV